MVKAQGYKAKFTLILQNMEHTVTTLYDREEFIAYWSVRQVD